MNPKKLKNTHHSSKSTNLTHFRPLIKSRANKETLRDVAHMSATLQQTISNHDNRSVKSTLSTHKKIDFEANSTDKIKSFVRNMKMNKQLKQLPMPVKIPKPVQNNNLSQSRASIHSVRSNRSVKSNYISMHLEKDILDNKSVISTRSMAEDGLPRSKICFGKEGQQMTKQKMIDKLNKMEQKMDYLMKNKLKNLMIRARTKHGYNPKPFLGARGSTQMDQQMPNDNMLEKQIQAIFQTIASLKQKDTEATLTQSQLEENITELDKKIQLLEKIIASNFTEAEILKKFYFAQKSQKCPHLSRKQRIIQEISKRKDMLKANASMSQMREMKNRTPIIKYESTSKYYYTKPSQTSYLTQKSTIKPFISNRQPLPRSSYDRQFLNYGTIPVFNYKPHNSKCTSSKMNVKTSNYQQAFKERQIELKQINYKELDCFKDKLKQLFVQLFRTGSISFSDMYQSKSLVEKSPRHQDSGQKEKQNTNNKSSIQKAIDTLSNLQKLSKMETINKFMGCTEVKREFVWHQEKSADKQHPKEYGKTSVMKDAKLNKYKAAYKMELLR